jgi:tetratricopeptide (TPR) repeat protein
MGAKGDYKPTFLDRHGPEGIQQAVAVTWGAAVFVIAFVALLSHVGHPSLFMVIACAAAALAVASAGVVLSHGAGWTWKRFMVDGTSTPYVEQYSYQQSLVMQGRLDEALASFEAIIAEQPEAIDPRLRAAELYDRDKKNYPRAASLFREVQRIEGVSTGQFVYVTNRLADLYNGPLKQPGKALVELRRLIDRAPGTPAADHARVALARLKSDSGPATP